MSINYVMKRRKKGKTKKQKQKQREKNERRRNGELTWESSSENFDGRIRHYWIGEKTKAKVEEEEEEESRVRSGNVIPPTL